MTKEQLTTYIMTRLGSPMINVEILPNQLSNNIDDTIQLFIESHYDGTDVSYYPLEVTIDTQIYTLPDTIYEVTKILNIANNMFVFDEPLLLTPNYGNSITPDVTNLDVTSIETLRYLYKTAEKTYNSDILFDFNSATRKVRFHAKPRATGTYICEVYQTEESFDSFYNNIWVKNYATALCKKTWGSNLGKFSGSSLPGGITVDYQRIISEADNELNTLAIELRDKYSLSSGFFIG